jgi:hypothetical protein
MSQTSIENALKIIGTVIAIIALVFTGCQIRETNKTLTFTTEQGVYKESRDLLKFIADNPAVMQLARSEDISQLDENARIKLSAQIGILLNFYNSILLERSRSYVSTEFRAALVSDFCSLIKFPQIAKRLPAKNDKAGPFQNLARIKSESCTNQT